MCGCDFVEKYVLLNNVNANIVDGSYIEIDLGNSFARTPNMSVELISATLRTIIYYSSLVVKLDENPDNYTGTDLKGAGMGILQYRGAYDGGAFTDYIYTLGENGGSRLTIPSISKLRIDIENSASSALVPLADYFGVVMMIKIKYPKQDDNITDAFSRQLQRSKI